MRNLATLSWVALCLLAPAAWTQTTQTQTPPPPGTTAKTNDHGNIGVFANYTGLRDQGPNQDQGLDLTGAGGRIGFKVYKPVMLEAEMSYDFERSLNQTVTAGGATSTIPIKIRMVHVLAGPKVQLKKGPVRVFAVAKAGIVNFGVSGPAAGGAINNQIGTIRNGDINIAGYPGAGIEFNIWRIGFRAEAGDEIMFLHGNTTHNVRASFGPQLRF